MDSTFINLSNDAAKSLNDFIAGRFVYRMRAIVEDYRLHDGGVTIFFFVDMWDEKEAAIKTFQHVFESQSVSSCEVMFREFIGWIFLTVNYDLSPKSVVNHYSHRRNIHLAYADTTRMEKEQLQCILDGGEAVSELVEFEEPANN